MYTQVYTCDNYILRAICLLKKTYTLTKHQRLRRSSMRKLAMLRTSMVIAEAPGKTVPLFFLLFYLFIGTAQFLQIFIARKCMAINWIIDRFMQKK